MPRPTDWPVPVKTPIGVTIGAVSATVRDDNPNRLTLDLVNTGADICWLSEGTPAVVGVGDAIYPAGTAHMDKDNLFLGEIFAISEGDDLLLVGHEGSLR